MKIGLKLTLMTVALAMMSVSAMASAPVITGIPSTVIVGDLEGNSPTTGTATVNDFVYTTDIDLTESVTDDDDASPFVWSYKLVTSGHSYTINNQTPADAGATDEELVSPSTWLYTNASANGDPADMYSTTSYPYQHPGADNDPATITFRNTTLSPIASPYGSSNTDASAGTGEIAGSDATLELIVSDGTTISEDSHHTIAIYSVNDEADGYSGGGDPILDLAFTAGTNGWVSLQNEPVSTIAAATQSGSYGLCIDVGTPTSASSDVMWLSATTDQGDWYTEGNDNTTGWLTLTANSAYCVRTELSTTAAANDDAPAQPMTLIQWTSKMTTWGGANLYLDNEGHANSVIDGYGDTTVDTWIVPPGVEADVWTDGLPATGYGEYPYGLAPGTDSTAYTFTYDLGTYTANLGNVMNFCVFFRVYDRDGDINSYLRNGQVCMKSILVERFSLDSMSEGTVIYDTAGTEAVSENGAVGIYAWESTMSLTDDTYAWTTAEQGAASTTLTYNGGVLTVAPATSTSWQTAEAYNSSVRMRPGSGTTYTTDAAYLNTCYDSAGPIPWVSDQLLLGRFTLSAGSDADNCGVTVGNVLIGFDSPATIEVAGVSFMTGACTRSLSSIDTSDSQEWDLYGTGDENTGSLQPYGPSMPKYDVSDWIVLFNTHSRTVADSLTYDSTFTLSPNGPIWANSEILRPRVDFSCDTTVINGNTTFTDAISISNVEVVEVAF